MLLKRELSSLLRTSYKKSTLFLLLVAAPILLYISSLEFIASRKLQSIYDQDIKELKGIQESKEENLQQLTTASAEYTSLLQELSNSLLKYQLSLEGEALPGSPQAFRDKWEQDTYRIKEKAQTKHIVLPPSFLLGLDEYKEVLFFPEGVARVAKQEALLNWIASEIITHPNLIVNEFKLENRNSLLFSTHYCSAFSLGYLTLNITTNESTLQQIINNITTGPYCLVIKKLTVENSSPTSPLRILKNHLLENESSSIKILFGREKANSSIIVQLIEVRR